MTNEIGEKPDKIMIKYSYLLFTPMGEDGKESVPKSAKFAMNVERRAEEVA